MDELDAGALLDGLLAERFPPVPPTERVGTGRVEPTEQRQRDRAALDAANEAVMGHPLP